MKMIDLRSDTVTQPTAAMREAMFRAEVGDDVYGEDPTIKALEEKGAALLGKEKALFCPSGTMSNLVALLTHLQPGNEFIIDYRSHIYQYEVGGCAALAGAIPHTARGDRGHLGVRNIEAAIREENIHYPETKLVCLENTHNLAGGTVMPMAQLADVSACAKEHGLKIHLDGARLFNAATALHLPASEITQYVDTVNICLSKGLAAPVGSLLCGTEEFIIKARKKRKMVGGGMRQAGFLAAAGIVALEDMTGRLAEDHALAQKLALGLAAIPGVVLDPAQVETNIVKIDLVAGLDAGEIVSQLKADYGVLCGTAGKNSIRFVTHYQIDAADIDVAIQGIKELLVVKMKALS
ncbi:MAG: low-specificity L-threonine aldolase [Peptococcaceae bacterium]|nr:low-specificity L-threonine aldolase [Peptococcaceae bacterium]